MKSLEWNTYRTRFLVKAKQLSSTLSFTDALGRHHFGRKGDYLVESSDGVISIAPRRIFEDIYVAMSSPADQENEATEETASGRAKETEKRRVIEEKLLRPSPLTRKHPQPCHASHASASRPGLM
jgi:hypothetical protein